MHTGFNWKKLCPLLGNGAEATPRRSRKWNVTWDIFFATLWCRVNRYSDRSESEQVGTRTVSHSPGGGGGGATWVNFCWVCPAGLLYSILWPDIDPILVTFGEM